MEEDQNNCLECNTKLVLTHKELYCPNCGLVVEDAFIEFDGESHETGEGEVSKSCGPPHRWIDPNSGTYSMIGNKQEFERWKKKRYIAFR